MKNGEERENCKSRQVVHEMRAVKRSVRIVCLEQVRHLLDIERVRVDVKAIVRLEPAREGHLAGGVEAREQVRLLLLDELLLLLLLLRHWLRRHALLALQLLDLRLLARHLLRLLLGLRLLQRLGLGWHKLLLLLRLLLLGLRLLHGRNLVHGRSRSLHRARHGANRVREPVRRSVRVNARVRGHLDARAARDRLRR